MKKNIKLMGTYGVLRLGTSEFLFDVEDLPLIENRDWYRDRRKLYVTDVRPLHRKADGKLFGYSIFTKSIGSGKESRFTVFCRVYDKDPIKSGDIIYCKGYERDGQYFKLTAYSKVI